MKQKTYKGILHFGAQREFHQFPIALAWFHLRPRWGLLISKSKWDLGAISKPDLNDPHILS